MGIYFFLGVNLGVGSVESMAVLSNSLFNWGKDWGTGVCLSIEEIEIFYWEIVILLMRGFRGYNFGFRF